MLLSALAIAGSCAVIGTLTTNRGFWIDAVPPDLTPLEYILHGVFNFAPLLMIASIMLLSGLPRHPLSRNLCILGCCMWGLGMLWFIVMVGLLL